MRAGEKVAVGDLWLCNVPSKALGTLALRIRDADVFVRLVFNV